jgi:hypothetical protein
MHVVAWVQDKDVDRAERQWIAELKACGADLLNIR